MFSPINELRGKPIVASVGEPWDFASTAGENKLVGTIHEVRVDARGQLTLLCDVMPFNVEGVEIHQVVAVNRYMGSQDVLATLQASRAATMNFLFEKSGLRIDPEQVDDFVDKYSSKTFLVGSISLRTKAIGA